MLLIVICLAMLLVAAVPVTWFVTTKWTVRNFHRAVAVMSPAEITAFNLMVRKARESV